MYVVAKIGKWMNIDGHGPCIVRWLAYDSHGDDQTRIHRVVTCSSDGWFRHSVLVGLGYHKTKYQDLQTIDHSYVNKLPEGISYVCMYIYIYWSGKITIYLTNLIFSFAFSCSDHCFCITSRWQWGPRLWMWCWLPLNQWSLITFLKNTFFCEQLHFERSFATKNPRYPLVI